MYHQQEAGENEGAPPVIPDKKNKPVGIVAPFNPHVDVRSLLYILVYITYNFTYFILHEYTNRKSCAHWWQQLSLPTTSMLLYTFYPQKYHSYETLLKLIDDVQVMVEYNLGIVVLTTNLSAALDTVHHRQCFLYPSVQL